MEEKILEKINFENQLYLKKNFMLISGLYTPAYCGTQSVAEAHLLLHRRTPASTEAGGLFLQRNRGHWYYMWLTERSTLSTPSDRKQKMRAKFMTGVEIKIWEVCSCFKLQTWSYCCRTSILSDSAFSNSLQWLLD